MDRPNSIGAKRFAVDSTVHLQFPGEQAPLAAALSNLSELGLFVSSEITYPASTEFNFRISGGDQHLAITGRGRVAWRRQLAAGTHRPAGMGCEILRLTEGSRAALKRRLSQKNIAEIPREPPMRQSLTQEISQQSIQDALLTQRVERPEYFRTMTGPPPRAKSKPSRTPLWIGGGVALLVLSLFGLLLSGLLPNPFAGSATATAEANNPATRAEPAPLRPEPTPATNASPTLAQAADTSTTDPVPANSATASSTRTDGAPTADSTQGARSATAPASEQSRAAALNLARVWSAAWSAQAIEDYLSFYGNAFQPANGASLRAWQRNRRNRLAAPEFISVRLENIRFEGTESAGTLQFRQNYRSNSHQDVVVKTLDLERMNGQWKIVAETARPVNR